MATDQWADRSPYKGAEPDAGGGSYSKGWNFVNPATGQVDPRYRPPAGTTDSRGQSGSPQGGTGSSGGAGAPLGGGGPAGTTPAGDIPASGFGGGGPGVAANAANAGGILGTSLKWGDIINAALAIYGLHESQKPPKIYPVPPSPSEQYRLDKTKGLYDFASNYTEQYLKGLGNVNPDFHMPNSLTGNPEFMGGVKAPVIDFGKMPSMSGAAASGGGPNPAAGIPPGVTPERVRVDPSTGKWIIDGATPEEQAWLDAANQSRTAVPSAGGSNSYAP